MPIPFQRPSPAWLDDAVFYQVYPQSFADSNGDGIGDLGGLIGKLDYLRSLGVNALWLNPIFDSPFGDAGYDIRDFRKVAPRYGTNADARLLFREAHKRGMRVVLDLVAGHVSTEHPWFKASCEAKPNKYSDWFIWTSDVWTAPPGNFIKGYAARDGNYLANFFWFQPALNYGYARLDPAQLWQQSVDAPGPRAVKAELKSVMEFWLKAGCDGFRVDMAQSLIKEDTNNSALNAFWGEFRGWLDCDWPEAILVSEWGIPKHAIPAGFHIDFMIHFGEPAYNALVGTWGKVVGKARDPHVFCERAGGGDIRAFLDNYLENLEATKHLGYISLPTGNHDYPRLRRGRDAAELRVIHCLLLTLPGVPFIYYGDEIGMDYLENEPAKEGSYANRTGTRTPMQWTPGHNRGFSTAPARALYLPVDKRLGSPDVATQEREPASHLNFIRQLITLRHAHPALGSRGDFTPLYAKKKRYPFVYARIAGKERFIIAINPCEKPETSGVLDLPANATFEPVVTNGARMELSRGRWITVMDGVSFGIFRQRSC